MPSISEAFVIAVEHHRAGRLDLAEEVYRRILQADPDNARVLHLLGTIACRLGRPEEAADCFQRAIELKPDDADSLYNLGTVRQGQGRIDEAIGHYRRAIEGQPDMSEAHYSLGNALLSAGKPAEAAACFQRAIELRPERHEPYEALGRVWLELGDLDQAGVCFRRWVERKPFQAEAQHAMGLVWQRKGRSDKAVTFYRRAIELKPELADAHYNLGVVYSILGRPEEAIPCFQRAIALAPDDIESYNHLGNAWKDSGKPEEAILCYRRALELRPKSAEPESNLGAALFEQGKLEEAIACFRQAIQWQPDHVAAEDNLLCALQYRPGITLAELASAHGEYQRRHAQGLAAGWQPHENDRDPNRPLRLGFVSNDFASHPVGYFLIRTLEQLDRRQCRVHCYCDRLVGDALTQRFRSAADAWSNTHAMTDERLAERIRQDRIDILFDLAGHTARNRLLVFARKPAPIQITWIGYVGTTGLAAMDYILADRHQVPAEAEPYYCEKVLRLPDGYVCFDPPAEAPPVGPLPALARGGVTLASFNNLAKITAEVARAWGAILRRLPDARLVIAYRSLESPGARSRLEEMFAGQAVAADRVELFGWSPRGELLARYNQVDLALDPFPYGGGLTTCEALWMGVPVVTCPGETFASRHSTSHLRTAGFTDSIAPDMDEYVELAVKLAENRPRLAEIRAGLREQVARSPLCDGRRLAENLAAVLREVWRRWVQQKT